MAPDRAVRLHLRGAPAWLFQIRGIDIDISRGYGSMAATQAVATGKFEMGGAQTGANLLSMMRGLDLRILGTQGYDATLGIIVPKNGPIATPKDLEGKKIGASAAGGDTPFLPAYCKLAGIDFSKVNVVQLDSKILEQSAMSGVVDGIVATGLSSIPNFVSRMCRSECFHIRKSVCNSTGSTPLQARPIMPRIRSSLTTSRPPLPRA